MDDEEWRKIGAHVVALELIVRHMVVLQFAATVSEAGGFAQAAELARRTAHHLRSIVRSLGVADAVAADMDALIDRVFALSEASLQSAADQILAVLQPPTDAKN